VRDVEVIIAAVLAVALAITTLVLASIGRGSEDEAATTTTTATVTTTDSRVSTGTTQTSGAGATKISFRGNGDRTLPPIRVPRGGTTLRWTNDGAVFSLFTETGALIDSVAPQGESFVPAGRHVLEIIASGDWTIAIDEFSHTR
jgi:hypothetical protein